MKKIIIKNIVLSIALFCLGCDFSNSIPQEQALQRQRLGAALMGASQGLNNAIQMNYQLKQQNPSVIYYPQQQQNSTEWQERLARQQYFERLRNQNYSMFSRKP